MVDEAQGNQNTSNYISERNCSKARLFLVLKWTLVGLLLTISYKSVLRAMLMKVEYEKTIDTLDDMMESGLKLMVPVYTLLPHLLKSDPRQKVKELGKLVQVFEHGNKNPEWIAEG